jgi:hypothetical protein
MMKRRHLPGLFLLIMMLTCIDVPASAQVRTASQNRPAQRADNDIRIKVNFGTKGEVAIEKDGRTNSYAARTKVKPAELSELKLVLEPSHIKVTKWEYLFADGARSMAYDRIEGSNEADLSKAEVSGSRRQSSRVILIIYEVLDTRSNRVISLAKGQSVMNIYFD